MEILKVVGITLASWVIHAGTVAAYMQVLPQTKSIQFRLVHAVEIAINVLIIFGIYFAKAGSPLSPWAVAAAALGTLAAIDILLYFITPSLWQKFDLIHVAAAYTAVLLAIIAASLIFKR